MNNINVARILKRSFIWTPVRGKGCGCYALFRRQFEALGEVGKVTAHVFADSRHLLYIDGQSVAQGPAGVYPSYPGHDTFSIKAMKFPEGP